mmetsp:Transcript_18581/g.33492  ORF Transcript_18581/g.33492 Transcript_18581/m.33492 type:complete len:119 (-) Transcript_18581:286-642(-)|eukprot:CAMPEP_0201647092 /NCGR_PEP_ID=MMETSP0493-20130528/35116_1 /ASSEMBLY_ACC=CAM_ASM_000838 /TAXON_ID=420259 /ORGANISM="Thalassiosira gravida, Strain GMp14c1" /LENGTH=118 /DNA_ID=CAMNT_0048122407 /DNA_START=371 /DNA_END=727 /DNA_ORIENTATION=-
MKIIDPSIQDVGSTCGIDVESLYNKYARVGVPGPAASNKQNSDNVVTGGTIAMITAAAARGDKKTTCTSTTNGLDRFRICFICHGYGLVKESYNHQVKEVNCGECEGEGIVDILKTGR